MGSSKISVITPLYNIDSVLIETVNSVKQQSFRDFEWIIVDDGSTDFETLKLLDLLPSLDDRIKIVSHNENKGLPAARNTGINCAKAPFLFFLDSDDLIDSYLLEKFYLFLSANLDFDFVNSYVVGFGDQDYKWTGGFHENEVFLKENRNTSCFMAKREVFDHVLFDEEMRYGCEDWDFWLNAASKGFWGYTIPEFLFYYRRSANNKWTTLEGKTSLEQIQKELNLKYSILSYNGFPKKELTSYEFGISYDKNDSYNVLDIVNERHIICVFPWLKIGGADQFNFNLLKGLSAKGWTITIVTTLGNQHPWEDKFREITDDIFHLNNLGTEFTYSTNLEYLISTRNPKMLFLSNSMYGYYSLPYLNQKFPSLPIADYVHCEDIGWYGGGYPYFSTLFSGFIDLSFTTSHDLKNWCATKGGVVDKTKVRYINVDTVKIKKDLNKREKIRRDLRIEENLPLILYVARLTEQKQPLVLLKTLNKLKERGVSFKCVIIGDGPDRKLLLNSIKDKKLDSFIHYLGDQPNEIVMDYMDAADIFFLPSKYEGIALSIYEAMAKGLAIVGAKVGGQEELVTKECGFLVNAENPKASINEYALILEELINKPENISELDKNARARVVQFFDSEAMIEDMHLSFTQLVTKKRLSFKDWSSSYQLVLDRMLYLESSHSDYLNKSHSKLFKLVDKYKKPYQRFRKVYHTLKGVIGLY